MWYKSEEEGGGVWYERARKRGRSVVQESEEEEEGVWCKSEEGSELRVDERESM